ncbi:MAG: hypothetical protein MK207_06810 [Saprospiraceae bacterium]|nr:hypothetical protein [Saprospiraceae bacterium]
MNQKQVFSTIFLIVNMVFSCFATSQVQLNSCFNISSFEHEDTYLLLAHKWESGALFLDLKLNGTFEASLDGNDVIYGNWELRSNQEVLVLLNDPVDEDVFSIEFTLSDVSFHSIKVINSDGKEFFFVAVE